MSGFRVIEIYSILQNPRGLICSITEADPEFIEREGTICMQNFLTMPTIMLNHVPDLCLEMKELFCKVYRFGSTSIHFGNGVLAAVNKHHHELY